MDEVRYQASVLEIISQRDQAQARCANLAGDLAVALARIKELEAPKPE